MYICIVSKRICMEGLQLNSQLFKNPNLKIYPIDSNFYSVVNPFISDGLKVINKKQLDILNYIEDGITVMELAKQTNNDPSIIILLSNILREKFFISNSRLFPSPQWNKKSSTLNLWIQTTNNCNLRCSYCYIHTLGQDNYLTTNQIETFIEKTITTAKQEDLKLVQLRFAGGEPFLKLNLWEKAIPKLREGLDEIGCNLKVAILSNLVSLNDYYIKFIKNNGIGIGVSLDGLQEFHDATRHFKNGKGSFDIVNKNILKLKDNGITPCIMSVISNSNIEGLESFTEYIIKSGLHTRYSIVSGEEIDINKLIDVLIKCYKIFESAIEDGYEFSDLHEFCDLKFDRLFFQTCGDGYNGGALFTNGEIYFCQRHFGVEKPLGNIYEDDNILSIIRRKTYYGKVAKECERCSYKYICTSGCPIERINGKDPHCEVYKYIIPIIFRLRGKEHLYKIRMNKTN